MTSVSAELESLMVHDASGNIRAYQYGGVNNDFTEKNENENCTILIPEGNSYCRRKSSARGPRFKVSSEGLSAEIDIPQQSSIQVQTKADVA